MKIFACGADRRLRRKNSFLKIFVEILPILPGFSRYIFASKLFASFASTENWRDVRTPHSYSIGRGRGVNVPALNSKCHWPLRITTFNFFKRPIFNIKNSQLIPSGFPTTFHLNFASSSVISCNLIRLTNADIVKTITSEFHSNLNTRDEPMKDMSDDENRKKFFITFHSLTWRLLNMSMSKIANNFVFILAFFMYSIRSSSPLRYLFWVY